MRPIRSLAQRTERYLPARPGNRTDGHTGRGQMPNVVKNYDGGSTATSGQLVPERSVAEIQAILRDANRYPGPVRAMGSYHSLTPGATSDRTIIRMSGMKQIVRIDAEKLTFTAEAGLEFIEASRARRKRKL